MDDVTKIFQDVFPDCQVFETDKAALQAAYPYIKKWERYRVSEHVTFYESPEPSREPWRFCKYHSRRVHPEVCKDHGGCKPCVKRLKQGERTCSKVKSKVKSVKQSGRPAASLLLFGKDL